MDDAWIVTSVQNDEENESAQEIEGTGATAAKILQTEGNNALDIVLKYIEVQLLYPCQYHIYIYIYKWREFAAKHHYFTMKQWQLLTL